MNKDLEVIPILNETIASLKNELAFIPILNEAKASMNRVLYEVPVLDKAIPSYLIQNITLVGREEKCEKRNNDLSSVKNCTGDDAEKFKVDIEQKINS